MAQNKYTVAGLGVLAVAGLAGAAFAAANTVPNSNAGQGSSTVSGFTVTNIEYVEADMTLETGDPTVDTVTFDIARDGSNSGTQVLPGNAQVFLELNADNYVECTVTAGTASCDTSGGDIEYSEVTSLQVVAFDSTANA